VTTTAGTNLSPCNHCIQQYLSNPQFRSTACPAYHLIHRIRPKPPSVMISFANVQGSARESRPLIPAPRFRTHQCDSTLADIIVSSCIDSHDAVTLHAEEGCLFRIAAAPTSDGSHVFADVH
jgi:hypothetical protein